MWKLSSQCVVALSALLILQHSAHADQEHNNTKTNATTSATTTSAKTTSATTTSATTTSPTTTSATTTSATTTSATTTSATNATNENEINAKYCAPGLCEFYNGTHVLQLPHIACHNNDTFELSCGKAPHLLYMSARRRNLILDMHNLARSRISVGLNGYKPAAHMPLLKWDNELEYLATLHVKRCKFAHDQCRNTPRFQYSGQNIGYYWIEREFKSHSRRMKAFIINWYREYLDANQTFIDSYYRHPNGKKIGHFTLLAADRVHRVGCAAVHFQDPQESKFSKFLMTCNYDFTNILGEPVYQTGAAASKCVHKRSAKFPGLCEWKDAVYDYKSAEIVEDSNLLDNNIPTL